jgi:hypothetical protein
MTRFRLAERLAERLPGPKYAVNIVIASHWSGVGAESA